MAFADKELLKVRNGFEAVAGWDGGRMISPEVLQQGGDLLFQDRPTAAALPCAGEQGFDSAVAREEPLAEVKCFSKYLDLSHSCPGSRS